MAAWIALFISLVSFILMIVILIRFKKLFSTDSIIDKTKSQMNRVIMDVNNNANRDLELINESSRRLRALLNEADKKMENFREATQLLRTTIAEAEKVVKKKTAIDPEASFRVNKNMNFQQGSLFDEVAPEQKSVLKDETIVTPEGAAFKEVPLIITKVYDDKPKKEESQANVSSTAVKEYPPKAGASAAALSKLSTSQKSDSSLQEKVEKLFKQGMQIEDIAVELSCSTSEVQFIIDML